VPGIFILKGNIEGVAPYFGNDGLAIFFRGGAYGNAGFTTLCYIDINASIYLNGSKAADFG